MSEGETKLLVGLGNPGDKYYNTRHNIGFELIEKFCSKHGLKLSHEKKFEAIVAQGDIDFKYTIKKKVKVPYEEEFQKTIKDPETGEEIEVTRTRTKFKKEQREEEKEKRIKVFAALPQTYMNDSGRAIQKIMNYYKIENEDLMITHDDVSLETGKLRAAFNGGAGGQHGVEDTIEKLGGQKNFHRLKFGVGPDPGGQSRANYVLATFPKAQADLLSETLEKAIHMLEAWLVEEDHQQFSL